MEFLSDAINMFLHLDKHLHEVALDYGNWIYLILFVIVFCETGLVVTPILPGDSLLFAAGALAGLGSLSYPVLFVLLVAAAILGDTANYWIGYYGGTKVANRFIKQKHLDRTHEFFEKWGGKTIIIARFVPIVRTFAPFVAGLGAMTYRRFMSYNVIGAVLWVFICVTAGFLFGNLAFVKRNFSLVILAIIFISLLPAIVEFYLAWRKRRMPAGPSASPTQAI